MAEVSFFILGALFTFALLAALLLLLAAVAQGRAMPAVGPDQSGAFTGARSPLPHGAPAPPPRRGQTVPRKAPAQLAGPGTKAAARFRPAEAYRIAAALDHAERTLTRIAQGSETAAAKIATQTLRRLYMATEPPVARMSFARQRLELLALRSDPLARLAARAALRAMSQV